MIQTWGIGEREARIKAKNIYSKIGSITCPFFNGEHIVFNRHGFNHLLRRGSVLRSKSERLIRLRLIEYAESIIKNHREDAIVEFRENFQIQRLVNRHGKKVIEKRKANAWGFVTTIDGSEVTLVVTQIEGKQKEFLSIMAKDFEKHPRD